MERETILYFYQQEKQEKDAAKRHWWQDAVLQSAPPFAIGEKGELQIRSCRIPYFYYRKREWKLTTMSEKMEAVLYQSESFRPECFRPETFLSESFRPESFRQESFRLEKDGREGMTDTMLSPSLEKRFPREERMRWRPRRETVSRLYALWMQEKLRRGEWQEDTAQIRLGAPEDVDWQMELVWELLQSYLPRINQCRLWYTEDCGMDLREKLEAYLERYAYEYGLVVQLVPYGKSRERADGISVDFRGDKLYAQAWKYLDTAVKNKYDE